MKSNILCLIFFISIINFNTIRAIETSKDTLKVYRLGEIIMTGEKQATTPIQKASMVNVPYNIIQNSDVTSVSDLQYYIPSGSVRTNSRGESMLFLKGAGERQLGLFFDGAAMNIPWDNRLDLTFVPADIIGNINVNTLGNSIFYGPNIMGGAVSISTLERADQGFGTILKVQGGDGNMQNYSLLTDGRINNFNYIANLSYFTSDGIMMSADAPDDLGNQNNNSSLRTNTDQNRLNAYIRGEYHFTPSAVFGLAVSYTKQEKGVAAETFGGEDARFWRFPDRNRFMITLNSEVKFSPKLILRTTIWNDIFSQQIDSYESFEYKTIAEIQYDDDKTIGTRISLNYLISDKSMISYALNGFSTNHKQHIDNDNELTYSQNTISNGLEFSQKFNMFSINLGLGYDYNQTPETGQFIEAEGQSQSDFAGFATLKYNFNHNFAISYNVSRSTRFPSMREQYDGALGSFKTNPDLKPESGLLNELALIIANNKISGKFGLFYNSYTNLIERIRLSAAQDSLKRRMRVNYSDATISGVDLNFNYQPINRMNLFAYYTYMNIQANQGDIEIKHLIQKPEMLAGISAYYNFAFGIKPQFEIEYTGTFYDSDPENDGEFLEIEPTTLFNLRLSYSFAISNIFTEVFVRVNNITDEYKLSQLGLPAAGRTFSGGVSIKL